jgi:hypothetical protein
MMAMERSISTWLRWRHGPVGRVPRASSTSLGGGPQVRACRFRERAFVRRSREVQLRWGRPLRQRRSRADAGGNGTYGTDGTYFQEDAALKIGLELPRAHPVSWGVRSSGCIGRIRSGCASGDARRPVSSYSRCTHRPKGRDRRIRRRCPGPLYRPYFRRRSRR